MDETHNRIMLIAIMLGYALFMVLVRRKGLLKGIGMTHHLEVKIK